MLFTADLEDLINKYSTKGSSIEKGAVAVLLTVLAVTLSQDEELMRDLIMGCIEINKSVYYRVKEAERLADKSKL